MSRLAFYMFRRFAGAILSAFLMVLFIGWLTQVLSQFGLVTAKGQTVLVFLAQTGLLLPVIAGYILPAVLMLGLARGFRQLDGSKELHAIHAAGRIGAAGAAVMGAALCVMAAQAINAHLLEPLALRAATTQTREINADLIARASVAGAFTEIEPGVTLRIDARLAGGEMRGFFLHDDRNPEVAQTIFADTASVSRLEDGIGVSLANGSIQFRDKASGNVSSVDFDRYQLGAAELIAPPGALSAPQYRTTADLLTGMAADEAPSREWAAIHQRLALPLYSAGLAALIFAWLGFPNAASRPRRMPPELWLLVVAVAAQGLGIVVLELAQRGPDWTPLIYLVPLLPLIPAAALLAPKLGLPGLRREPAA